MVKKQDGSKLYGFMHICIANQWREIFDEQIQTIRESGLYDAVNEIYFGIVGSPDVNFTKILQLKKFRLAYVHPDLSQFEFMTLEFLHNFCQNNYDAKVFYIHTKGISTYGKTCNPPSPARQRNIDDWRRYLEYYLITNYKRCVEELNTCDMVGVNWRGKGTGSVIIPQVDCHFSGNFWWARASYISTLGEVREGNQKRCNAEFWIGKGDGIASCLHESNKDHYRNIWPLEKYQGKFNTMRFNVSGGISERLLSNEKNKKKMQM